MASVRNGMAMAAALVLAACSGGSAPGSNIRENVGKDDFDGAHIVDLTLTSDDNSMALDLICRDDRTRIMLGSRSTLTAEDGLNVLARFGNDDQNVPKETWLTTTNHRSALYDGDKDEFIRGLLGAAEFKVRISPIGADSIDAKFSTAGLAAALARHANVCGWGDLLKPATPPSTTDTTSPPPPAPTTANPPTPANTSSTTDTAAGNAVPN